MLPITNQSLNNYKIDPWECLQLNLIPSYSKIDFICRGDMSDLGELYLSHPKFKNFDTLKKL